MKSLRMKNLEISRKLLSVAERKFASYARKYPDEKIHKCDVRDLSRIADLIGKGSTKAALRKLEMLDTAVRDSIPKYIWDFLERGLPEDQRTRWNPRFYKPSKRTLTWPVRKRKVKKREKDLAGARKKVKRFKYGG